jgi:monothiol glutaredoxin
MEHPVKMSVAHPHPYFSSRSGFSNNACRILEAVNTPFETVDVLEDMDIRTGIKAYSMWPTIPQLYVNGEFIGGSDIMIELYNNGELAEMIEVANAN